MPHTHCGMNSPSVGCMPSLPRCVAHGPVVSQTPRGRSESVCGLSANSQRLKMTATSDEAQSDAILQPTRGRSERGTRGERSEGGRAPPVPVSSCTRTMARSHCTCCVRCVVRTSLVRVGGSPWSDFPFLSATALRCAALRCVRCDQRPPANSTRPPAGTHASNKHTSTRTQRVHTRARHSPHSSPPSPRSFVCSRAAGARVVVVAMVDTTGFVTSLVLNFGIALVAFALFVTWKPKYPWCFDSRRNPQRRKTSGDEAAATWPRVGGRTARCAECGPHSTLRLSLLVLARARPTAAQSHQVYHTAISDGFRR